MVVSLGPTSMASYRGLPKNPFTNGTGINKRCLRRDINRNAALGATADRAYKLLTESSNMDKFYNTLLGTPPPRNDPYPWGVSFAFGPCSNSPADTWKHQIHTAGHYIHAVDPGGDPSTSPGDPVFYFHHGALDRLWWIWQMQDPENRLNAVPMHGVVMDHGGGHMGARGEAVTGPLSNKEKRQRITDPTKMIVDLEWLSPIKTKLMDAHDQLGGNEGRYCYVYI